MAAARDSTDLPWLTIDEAARGLRRRHFSAGDLARACLQRIERLDHRLNSFITVTADEAIAAARRCDRELAAGADRGPLHGIPIAIKDNIDTAGIRTTAASAAFANRVPTADAAAVSRLREAGAVVLGKLNMHEIALGTTSAISAYGPVRNPWDTTRIAGGSSGGCGAAVAAGLCLAAVGTDTGGSVRVPAAACGVVGFKPTFGVVSTAGVMLLSEEFDHVGPLCRTVVDAAHVVRAMSDHSAAATCAPEALPPVRELRIGVLPPAQCDGPLAAEVELAVREAVRVIRSLVARVTTADVPMPVEFGALIDAEAWARYSPAAREQASGFDPRTRRTLGLDGAAPSVDLPALRRGLARHRERVADAFRDVDLVVGPTTSTPALPLELAQEPFAQGSCTFAFSLGGLPSISVPCGMTPDGLPLGLLISGPALADARVLALAAAFESQTTWHRRRPTM